jgi:hypothetical protein
MIPERKSMYRLRKDGLEPHRTWPPTEGYYETKGPNGQWLPIKISFEAARDPETGEILDRSPMWVADVNGVSCDVSTVWPECSGRKITRDQYLKMLPF